MHNYLTMKSRLTHKVAILRDAIDISQREFAKLVGRNQNTIASIEAGKGRLNLSPALAQEISKQAGVSLEWLASDDLSEPIVDVHGQPYTKEFFEGYQAEQYFGEGLDDIPAMYAQLWSIINGLAGAAIQSAETGNHRLFWFRAVKAVKELAKDFGVDADCSKTYPLEKGGNLDGATPKFKAAIQARLGEMYEQLERIALAREDKGQSRSQAARGKSKTKSLPRRV